MSADRFVVSNELIHRYSRRGNFHTDSEHSESLGLPGLVAQGTQASGRAYGQLLDAWGEDFLAHGSLEFKFVGMVIGGDEIETNVDVEPGTSGAVITVKNLRANATAVVGSASIENAATQLHEDRTE